MSSIAYVTDEKMIEYHRLCGNRDIIFWRLSNQKRFKYFKKGDLLFFFTRPAHSRKKGFVGYAHYDSTKKMSLSQMWKRYGRANGYDTIDQLRDAIQKAARDGKVPEKMNCLFLTGVVFFVAPVYPDELGIDIKSNLESYYYIDKDDPMTTARILKKAESVGIDLWSSVQSSETENIFRQDEIRHQLANVASLIGTDSKSKREEQKARSLAKQFIKEQNCELIRGSETDCIYLDGEQINIVLPYVCQVKNRNARRMELFGKIVLYQIYMERSGIDTRNVKFKLLTVEDDGEELAKLVEEFNHA